MRHIVFEELKKKSGKNLFRKLNEHSKALQVEQEEIIKKHNLLAAQYKELEHLKVNMEEYLSKTKKKKQSLLGRKKLPKNQKDKELSVWSSDCIDFFFIWKKVCKKRIKRC